MDFRFSRPHLVTVSGADAIVDKDREELAETSGPMSPRRWITPPMPMADRQGKARHLRRHPGAGRHAAGRRTGWRNLFLAGDWTQTGLPATIEGAVRSGETAAALAPKHLSL
jgi:hypothetical protein